MARTLTSPKPASAVSGLLVLAVGTLAVWLAWRSRGWPLIHDAPIMHYLAWRIAEGAAPYRDLFDMNFPGVYAFHLGVIRSLGAGDAAWRAVDLGMTALTAIAVAAMAAPWGRPAAVGGACFFAAYHLAGGAWNAGQRDFLLCPFLLLGSLGLVRWIEMGGRWSLAAGGLAFGAALTIKPHAIVLVVALAVFAGLGARRPMLGTMLTFAAALLLAPAAVVLWIAEAGALGAWRDIVFGYLVPLYSQVNRPGDWLYLSVPLWTAIGGAVVLNVLHLAWTRRLTPRHTVVILGVAYGLLHFVGQRKGWEYHLYPLAAFAAVLVFAEVGAFIGSRRRLTAVPIVVVLAAIVYLLAVKGDAASAPPWIAQKARRVAALSAALAARTRPGDLVQILDTTGGGAHALLRLHLTEPTRFVYDFHLFHHVDAPMIQRLRGELVDALKRRPPALVVVWEDDWPRGGYDRFDGFPALQQWLTSTYAISFEGDGYRIYAQRHDS